MDKKKKVEEALEKEHPRDRRKRLEAEAAEAKEAEETDKE